ncbi:helix-turn-helix domain-containing protein [Micromonospora sp. NPDC048830]|uniref:helix-turn-helix domain-containing protein n=1 Tax=Micromonospora sp. NPDC048830 TaxID=3364257 RepID=UPI0037157EC0
MGDGRGPNLAPQELTAEEREVSQGLARRPKTGQALAVRARIVLACAQGLSSSEVSCRLGVSLPMVDKWRKRFVADRVDGLRDEPRPGAPREDRRRPGPGRDHEDPVLGRPALPRVCPSRPPLPLPARLSQAAALDPSLGAEALPAP